MLAPGYRAPTVTVMIFVILGIAAGLAVSLGPLSDLAGPVDGIAAGLVTAASRVVEGLLARVGDGGQHTLATVVAVVVGSLMPGLTAWGLVMLARASMGARRAASAAIVVAALLSFLVLPWGAAAGLVVLALVVCALANLVGGTVVTLPLVGIATVISVRYVVLLWRGEASSIGRGAARLAEVSAVHDVGIWQGALSFVAVAMVFLAAWAAIKD